jgi:hypothetical protein
MSSDRLTIFILDDFIKQTHLGFGSQDLNIKCHILGYAASLLNTSSTKKFNRKPYIASALSSSFTSWYPSYRTLRKFFFLH